MHREVIVSIKGAQHPLWQTSLQQSGSFILSLVYLVYLEILH